MTNTYSPPDNPTPTPQRTPNPYDPDSGLKIIGGVTARYSRARDEYTMSASYGDYPGMVFNSQYVPIDWFVFSKHAQSCAGDLAATAAAAQNFVDKLAASQFLPRLEAAIAGASFTSLTLWEAVGVALATIPAGEMTGILIAAGITLTMLYVVFVCMAKDP